MTELWTLEEVAGWLKVSDDTARITVSQPDFPIPVVPGREGKNSKKRWFSDEVIGYFRDHRKAA
jgi:hypothetical protein